MRAKGVLFDKDGTLFDFQKSWASWTVREIKGYAAGDADKERRMAETIGLDLDAGLILPHSPVIAGTSDVIATCLLPFFTGRTIESLAAELNARAMNAEMVEVLPLVPFLKGLAGMGLKLGVATNDNEAAARSQLDRTGATGHFDYIAGYDSGHGAKPGAGMCTAFSQMFDLDAGDVIMVGDSLHDLDAGRAAGMQTVAVLTGVATTSDLQDHADIVLPDIGHLADWITA